MTRDDAVREAIRARIEWLRILGVSAIATGGAPGPASSDEPRARQVSSAPPPAARSAPGVASPSAPVMAPVPAAVKEAPADLLGGEPAAPAETPGPKRPAAVTPMSAALAADRPAGAEGLRLIREEIGDCRRCRLCEKRTQVVFGVGSPEARLMFVGEGPGADEDAQGEPFVGRAGQLLTKMIEAMGLKRSQVYIANVVKCRPPENRTPLPDEVATCSPFLFRQIAAIRPRVIVCLGTPSAQAVLGTRETITRLRGTFRDVGGVRVMPTFHPAYLLRNPAAKREVWDDLRQVMALLAGS